MDIDLQKQYKALKGLTSTQSLHHYCRRCCGARTNAEIDRHELCPGSCFLEPYRTGKETTNLKDALTFYCLFECNPDIAADEICTFQKIPCAIQHIVFAAGPISLRKRAALAKKYTNRKHANSSNNEEPKPLIFDSFMQTHANL